MEEEQRGWRTGEGHRAEWGCPPVTRVGSLGAETQRSGLTLCVEEGAVVLKAGLVKKPCQEGDSRSQALPFSSSARLTVCRNGWDLQTGTQAREANSG